MRTFHSCVPLPLMLVSEKKTRANVISNLGSRLAVLMSTGECNIMYPWSRPSAIAEKLPMPISIPRYPELILIPSSWRTRFDKSTAKKLPKYLKSAIKLRVFGPKHLTHANMQNMGTHTVPHGRYFRLSLCLQQTQQTATHIAKKESRHSAEIAKVTIRRPPWKLEPTRWIVSWFLLTHWTRLPERARYA